MSKASTTTMRLSGNSKMRRRSQLTSRRSEVLDAQLPTASNGAREEHEGPRVAWLHVIEGSLQRRTKGELVGAVPVYIDRPCMVPTPARITSYAEALLRLVQILSATPSINKASLPVRCTDRTMAQDRINADVRSLTFSHGSWATTGMC